MLRAWRLARAPALIQVVGPDGAGKGVVSRDAVMLLESAGLRVGVFHFDPLAAPRDIVVGSPHGSSVRGAMLGVLSVGRRFLRYLVAQLYYWRREQWDVVLQERGWWDQIVDPTRYRLASSSLRLVRTLGRCLARPSLVIFCLCPPGRAVMRKPELSCHEYANQNSRWQALSRDLPLYEVDTGGDIDSTRAQVAALINTWVGSRK